MSVKVKEHPRLTKKGRLVKVKEHIRTLSPSELISDLNKFKKELRIRLSNFIIDKKNITEDDRNNFINNEKINVVKVFLKHLSGTDPLLKRMSNKYFVEINSEIKEFFKSLIKRKKKKEKSELYFGYFADGSVADKLINKGKDIKKGDILYNQNCSEDNNWDETLSRKGLRILQVIDTNEKNIKFMVTNVGDNKKYNVIEKVLPYKKMKNYIKSGE